jgi:hypothetical protein
MSDEVKTEVKTEAKKPSIFSVCSLKVVDGHIEADCQTKESSHELAELLEHEVIIRVKPVKVTEEPSK